ncbi:MAG: ISAs1 family transposase [Lachnospiraceae bacterium]|nr:ISAs1 family transposase [Lachnospiraceae bacterium]
MAMKEKQLPKKGTDEIIIDERYFLCSIKPIAELFAIVVRRHWHIENNLHWAMDIVFKENKLRSKEKNGIHNFGLIRRFVLFIIKLLKAYYHRSMKRIRSKIGRNPELELPVILAVLKVLYDNDMLNATDEHAK